MVVRGWMPRALAFDERVTVELRCHNLFVETGETVTQTQYLVSAPASGSRRSCTMRASSSRRCPGDWAGTPFGGDEPIMVFVARAR